jgi:hypothetical protein
MSPIDYYREQFRHDLEVVAAGFDSISVVSLKGREPGGYREESSQAFQSLDEKRPFLFCYFFCVLLDQAVHTGGRDEHSHFDTFWQCPKFQGILGTAHTNLHPALILDAAVWLVDKGEEESSSAEFAELAEFFSEEYRRVLMEDYPGQSGRLSNESERHAVYRSVLAAAAEGLAVFMVPGGFEGLLEDAPRRKRLYSTWVLTAGRIPRSTSHS